MGQADSDHGAKLQRGHAGRLPEDLPFYFRHRRILSPPAELPPTNELAAGSGRAEYGKGKYPGDDLA